MGCRPYRSPWQALIGTIDRTECNERPECTAHHVDRSDSESMVDATRGVVPRWAIVSVTKINLDKSDIRFVGFDARRQPRHVGPTDGAARPIVPDATGTVLSTISPRLLSRCRPRQRSRTRVPKRNVSSPLNPVDIEVYITGIALVAALGFSISQRRF